MATRTAAATGGATTENRHYLSSRQAAAAAFQGAGRRPWGIENRLHRVLDVIFGKDHRRKRAGHLAANCAIIRQGGRQLLRAQPEGKRLNRNQNRCALSDEHRQKCLGF